MGLLLSMGGIKLDFQNMVQTCFKANSAGKSFVERGEYDIINEENGALLRVEDWTVRPGMTLSMAIILRKSIKKGENDYRCPACKTQYTRPVGTAAGYDLERVQCMDKYCKRWFQISSEVTAVATIDAYTITGEQSDLSSTTSYSGEHSKVDDDLTSIQRFHIRVKEISRVIGKDQFGTSGL
ncbi:hypothetical protein P167DRAFT_404274 [Morchella conica CCBAS932]|uniref:Ubiquitin-like domain-containing protein n=1 Tax=Morchella conica CCBAS932 TaxID=1392247 RepID=A0A3N4KGF2_9PEZI|nr:hypothetical protein P167DRAFT_404274 [Morchella conica CCBAS932]